MFTFMTVLFYTYLAPPTRTVQHAPVVVRHAPVAASEAPPAEELIAAAEHFMNEGNGYYSKQDASLFAEDYIFRGPSIGPLNLRDYTSVMLYFMMYEAFEDFSPNAFGYTVRPTSPRLASPGLTLTLTPHPNPSPGQVDPMDPLRVWFFVRASGTYTAPVGGAFGKLAAAVTPPSSRTRYQRPL